ncbi:MAG TPA: ABC transporter substrate binding protein [Nitrospirota bacterium]|nr:ABC transporter substrate binding protein [Nitrospirota bacterium]
MILKHKLSLASLEREDKNMIFQKSSVVRRCLLVSCIVVLSLFSSQTFPADQPQTTGTFRILHIMSFDSPWRWTDGQLAGFKEGLGDVTADYRIVQMDVKRNSTHEAKERKGREAREIIETWKPDLVYTSDDDAQEYVVRYYLGSTIPFVFSGVNKSPQDYGFDRAMNVTGVLEQEHFIESVRLLQAMVPGVKRIAVISDKAPHWTPVIARIRSHVGKLPGIRIAAVDQVAAYEEYKKKIKSYPAIADAVLYLGIFNFRDEKGMNVPYEEVQKWTVSNSRLPDISFWVDRVFYGVLASVTVSELEQGFAAGRLARLILIDGKKPGSLPMLPTVKGHPVISLARARQLGINVSSTLLLSSEVVTAFEWEKKAP